MDGARTVLVEQAAALLGVSRRTVYYRIRDGRLRTIQIGVSRRVFVDSIEDLLRGMRRGRLPPRRAGAHDAGRIDSAPTFAEAASEPEPLPLQIEPLPRDPQGARGVVEVGGVIAERDPDHLALDLRDGRE